MDSENYHQELMNKAHDKWEDSMSMKDWFESLDQVEKYAVASGKFNYQVENGGWTQWVFNGYAEVMCEELIEFISKVLPQNEVTEIIKKFLETLYNKADEYNWGKGFRFDFEEVDCPECGGSGRVDCPECDGDDDECLECSGDGFIYCPECDGSGTVEEETSLNQLLELEFEVDYKEEFDDNYYEVKEEFLKICNEYFKFVSR